MIKQIGEIKNKCIYNDKNAYLSIPLLMMSTRCMNLCREKKNEKKNGEKMTKMREKNPVWAKQQKPNEQHQQQKNHLK